MERRHFKLVRQLDAMDCGPACLAMVLAHHGKTVDSDALRRDCALGKDGVSMLGVSRAAEMQGMRTVGGRITFDVLANEAPLPCIAHWNQNHFVVVYRTKRLRNGDFRIYVADPGKGLLSYTRSEFEAHWISTVTQSQEKGVVLLLEPGKDFYISPNAKEGDGGSKSRFRFLGQYLKQYRRYFGQIALGLLAGVLIQPLFPFLTQAIVDVGIGGKDISFIWLILIAQLMLIFSSTAISFIRSKLLLHISTRINISLVSDFFIKLMRLPMPFFETKLLGDLLQRIEDHRRVEQFLTSSSLSVVFSSLTFLTFGVVLAYYNLPVFTIFLIGTALYVAWITSFLKRRRKLDYLFFEKAGRNRNVTYQLLTGMQEIKLQGCEQRKRWEWEDAQAELFQVNVKRLNLQQMQQAGNVAINELKNILITVFAASAVIKGEITLGVMLAIQYIIGQLNGPVEQLVQFVFSWQDVSISLERMQEIHGEQNEATEQRVATDFKGDRLDIALRDVEFRYDPYAKAPTLEGINLTIPNGKVTAIVGASGSGKTTLLKLLLGFYEPQKGAIEVAGRSLADYNLSWWRQQCGVVMQEGFLFNDTIGRNIAISDNEPDFEKIRAAARVANIANYIENLPLGYNTIIGQDGQGISQGQRQRILIARMVYKNPPFVLLDEATNALDAKSERQIVERLASFYKGKTVIVAAHRLSTVKNADQIVVLDAGRIAEVGTHTALIATHGYYYELVKNQLELGN